MMYRAFKGWCHSVDFLGGGVCYPRWLRRLYILLWPVAAPIRGVLFGFDFIGGLILLFIIAAIAECVVALRDSVGNLFHYLNEQWN